MLTLTDNRKGVESSRVQATSPGDLFATTPRKVEPMARRLIATINFATQRGMVLRWTRFVETPRKARYRLENGQAMEDVTTIDGLDIGHAMVLGRVNIRTFDELAGAEPEDLRGLGLDPDAVASILSWRNSLAPKEPDPEPDDLGSIKGVGPANVQLLHGAEVATFDQLRALDDDKLEAIGLSGPAMAGIRRWRGDDDE